MMRRYLAFAFAVLLPGALVGADDGPTKEERAASARNLKEIGRAFHDAHDALEFLPGDIVGKDGKARLSWRVALLPYYCVDEKKLYDEFKLDESWDSKHNLKLLEKMPKVYAPVRGKSTAGTTFYQSFYGPKTLFDPAAKKRPTLQSISQNNGTSNTVLVIEAGVAMPWTKPPGLDEQLPGLARVEAGVAMPWTKPLDLPFDTQKALPARGGLFDGDFHALFCDGAVRFFDRGTSEKGLKYAIQPDNTEVFSLPEP